ncbi:nucleoside hydrolase [Candidatus Woesebacteria bacterium]|nr:nucleoside hydrolase [Candidatus Woesebacteria bacterium]
MNKIIIDTDPGVDDALAIMLASASSLDICGITTVFGNSSVTNCTRNALTILQILNSCIPVYKGSNKPIQGKATQASSHGDNGLGGYTLPNLRLKSQGNALRFIEKAVSKYPDKTIDLVALGPLTNIASFGQKYPELINRIRRIIILGGVFNEPGNITPYAEFNTFNDPWALKKVLSFPVEKILIPANVCRKVVFTLEDFQKIQNVNLKLAIQAITQIYIDYYKNDAIYGGFAGGVMYDLLAIAYEVNPNIFVSRNACVSVDTMDQL